MPTDPEPLRCEEGIWSGPRKGEKCGRRAVMFVVDSTGGYFVCGVHRSPGLIPNDRLVRLAYWKPKEQAWL